MTLSRTPHRSAQARRSITPALCMAIALALPGAPLAARATIVLLSDGSAISGDVVSLKDGVYTIRSPTLGTLTVKQSDVRTLTEDVGARARSDGAAPRSGPRLEALQAQMAADPATVDAITALQNDPAVTAVLNDPEVLRALQNGNLDALLANPNVARLAADPRLQEITKRFAH